MRSQVLLFSLTSAGLLFVLCDFAVLAQVRPAAETNGDHAGTVQRVTQTKQKTNQQEQQQPTTNRRLNKVATHGVTKTTRRSFANTQANMTKQQGKDIALLSKARVAPPAVSGLRPARNAISSRRRTVDGVCSLATRSGAIARFVLGDKAELERHLRENFETHKERRKQ
jgi:hypothetical protein